VPLSSVSSRLLLHNKPTAEVHLGHKLTGPKEEEEEEDFLLLNIKDLLAQ
jgi:hypothetical protein